MSISYEEFKKCEMKMGTILVAETIEGSEKLLRLEVDFGDFQRQILSGIAKFYKPEDLIGKQLPFILNLEPRKMMGFESQGMLIATNDKNAAVLLLPERSVPLGADLC